MWAHGGFSQGGGAGFAETDKTSPLLLDHLSVWPWVNLVSCNLSQRTLKTWLKTSFLEYDTNSFSQEIFIEPQLHTVNRKSTMFYSTNKTEDLSPGYHLSDSSDRLPWRGKEVARIYRSVCNKDQVVRASKITAN